MRKFFLTQEDKNLLKSDDKKIFNNKNLEEFAANICDDEECSIGGAFRQFRQFRQFTKRIR